MSYIPPFLCKYCNSPIPMEIYETPAAGIGHGGVGLCSCPESAQVRELEHRMAIERRKRLRRGEK